MEQANIPSVAKAFSECANIISGLPTEEQRQSVLQLLRTLLDSMPQPRATSAIPQAASGTPTSTVSISDHAVEDEKIEMAIRHSSIEGAVWERFLYVAIALDQRNPGMWFTGGDLNKYLAPFRSDVRNVTNAVAPLVENQYLRQRKDGAFWNYSLTARGRAFGLKKIDEVQPS